jgi:D-sedoheptulose 7-phosphate isomerase
MNCIDVDEGLRQQAHAFFSHRQTALEETFARLLSDSDTLARVAALLVQALRSGHKILLAGNGGSAAQAQHFAAELIGRFQRERPPYAALALTTDSSILTALANDYSYEDVFVRQIVALGRSGDLLIAFSTSGESANLIRAAEAAHSQEMAVVALTGNRPSRLESAADLAVHVPADETPIVQEVHMMMTHLLCGIAEAELSRGETGS